MKKAQVQGFTLLEILIGMTLLSLIMLLLFAGLRTCVQSWNAGEKKIAQVSQAAIIHNFFRSKLQATRPLNADFFEEKKFSFQGDEKQLQFVASMPASANRLGLQLFKMHLNESIKDKQGSELWVDIEPFFPQGEERSWKQEQVVVLKKIESLQFAYFGMAEFSDEAIWQSEWLEQSALPQLVSIDIELINGNAWPTMIVALKIDAHVKTASSSSTFTGINPFLGKN